MRLADVYLFGRKAGRLEERDDGIFCFRYYGEYLASEDPIAVSLTMPHGDTIWESPTLMPFFDGLIPKGRDELALTLNGKKRKFGAADFDSFAGSIGLTTMQSERANKRILAAISRHLGESLSSSFLSDGFKGRVSRLISDNTAVLG